MLGRATPGWNIRKTAEANRPDDNTLFDLWMEQRLRQAFDGVSREPVPPELIALIVNQRCKS